MYQDLITLLKRENIFGDQAFEIFEKYGKRAGMTDFAIATGCVNIEEYLLLSQIYTSYWWTQTTKGFHDVHIVSCDGDDEIEEDVSRNCGIRPAFSLYKTPSIIASAKKGADGIFETEYGSYPQSAASLQLQRELLRLLTNNKLDESGKRYTIDSRKFDKYGDGFQSKELIEYTYQGKRYVYHKFNSCHEGALITLSNKQQYKDGDFVFYEVQPVKWLVDFKAGWAIAKYILLAGIQFNNHLSTSSDFPNTNMNKFLQNHMTKDLFQNNYTRKNEQITSIKKKNNNPYNLSFDQVSEEEIIKGCIESGIAPYLHAPTGDGKSARIHQLDPECEIIYLVTATPESINGKSVYNAQTGEIIDVMPSWLKKVNEKCEKEPDKIHIIFFDEFTNASATIQKLFFNIVLDREVNGKWKLPKNCAVAAAGNETKDSQAAHEMVEPMFNRFAHVYINTTVESWLDWATTPKKSYQRLEYKEEIEYPTIHPAIYSFVSLYRELVLRTPYNGQTPNANPRKWELASKLLYKTGKPEMLRALVGEEITASFCDFCHQSVITLEDVISGNYDKEDLQMDMATSMAMIASLSSCEEKHIEIVREFVKNINQGDEELTTTFDSLWSHGNFDRLEKIAELKMEEASVGGMKR